MEMRKNEFKETKQMGKEIEIDFTELETAINETIEGFALIDTKNEEEIYTTDKLDELFDVINESTIKKISYINDPSNALRLKKVYISLKDNTKYTLESL